MVGTLKKKDKMNVVVVIIILPNVSPLIEKLWTWSGEGMTAATHTHKMKVSIQILTLPNTFFLGFSPILITFPMHIPFKQTKT